jgi:hypothetical protein
MSSENINVSTKYKNLVDKLIKKKGYVGQVSYCHWNGTNCPSQMFSECIERYLGEEYVKADDDYNDEKMKEISEKLDQLNPLCDLERYLNVDCGKIQHRLHGLKIK